MVYRPWRGGSGEATVRSSILQYLWLLLGYNSRLEGCRSDGIVILATGGTRWRWRWRWRWHGIGGGMVVGGNSFMKLPVWEMRGGDSNTRMRVGMRGCGIMVGTEDCMMIAGIDRVELGGICSGREGQPLLLFLDGSCRCSFGRPGLPRLRRRLDSRSAVIDGFFLFARLALLFGGCSRIVSGSSVCSCLHPTTSVRTTAMLTLQRQLGICDRGRMGRRWR